MFRHALGIGLIALTASSCSQAPTAPAITSSVAPPAAPTAVLSIGRGSSPPLVLAGAHLAFDASASSSGATPLSYTIEFGDGVSVPEAVASHPVGTPPFGFRRLTAKLTVTDALGRIATTTQDYFVASLPQPSATFWVNRDGANRKLVFRQNGVQLSGTYGDGSRTHSIIGRVNADRTFTFETDDGQSEFDGSIEWRTSSPNAETVTSYSVVLRIVVTRGPQQGKTLDFLHHDPY